MGSMQRQTTCSPIHSSKSHNPIKISQVETIAGKTYPDCVKMYKLRRLLGISIALIYFTFICSQEDALVRRVLASGPGKTAPKSQQKTVTANSDSSPQGGHSNQDKAQMQEQLQDGLKHLLRLKERPSKKITTANTKIVVPRAMLEKYMEYRDLAREYIPDDREFFGKLDIHSIEDSHEKFWNKIDDRGGQFGIEVDLKGPNKDPEETKRFKLKGDVDHLVHIRLNGDPEEVPQNIEPQLPPHVTSVKYQKQYISVHLKFNLSQEVYTKLATKEDLIHADLHLTRDRISGCLFEKCDRRPTASLNKKQTRAQNQATRSIQTNSSENPRDRSTNAIHLAPLYQRVFVLLVTGYDDLNEPMAAIVANMRISTRDDRPLVVDLGPVVKRWIDNPSANYGIIVRVRNDDEVYERQMLARMASEAAKSGNKKREIESRLTNASETEPEAVIPETAFLEQVRLKRGFEQSSDDEATWITKQPYIIAYSKTSQQDRHKKRNTDLSGDDTDGMQADDPSQYQPTDTSTANPASPTQSTSLQTETNPDGSMQTSTHESVTKRNHVLTPNGGRRGQPSNRPSSYARAPSPPGTNSGPKPKLKGKPPSRPIERCGKRPLKINFDEVGWSNWIIAPASYYANYCAGSCAWPLGDVQNSTNHAIVQAVYNDGGRVVPKPCCAPVKLSRMAILYQLEGVVQLRDYDDMIAEACGCL